MKKKLRFFGGKANYGFQIVAVGGLTGLFAGIVVTLYNIVAEMITEFARDELYAYFRTHAAFIPLLFLALFLGAIVIGGVVRFIPMISGSGIAQAEGASRGLMRFKWYEVLTGMFAASLFTIFMGLSAGSEGPSILIGGSCGSMTSDLLRRNAIVRRYQITGGASAGLAVAFNAPLTGMAFAFEEAHKRFTPEVFICAFSSVIVAVVARNLLRTAMGLSVGAAFSVFSGMEVAAQDPIFLVYVLLAAVVCALLGVAFYYLVLLARRLFRRITFFGHAGKMLVPFALAGAFGLITAYAMGGGANFICSLAGDGMSGLERIFSTPLWATLLIVVLFKLIATVANIGAGVPCGAFIPMLAIGAGTGALMSLACQCIGMDAAYSDALVIISMAAFFTTVVRTPITGVVMTVELTWNFMFLLPVILGVAVGYVTGELFRTDSVYDKLLDEMLGERRSERKKVVVRLRVEEDRPAAGRELGELLWPFSALVTEISRGGETFAPKGSAVLETGDELTVEGTPENEKEYLAALRSLVGERIG